MYPVSPQTLQSLQADGVELSRALRRINRKYELYPLTEDEEDTCLMMVQQSQHSSLLVMPTHRINEHGEFQGFRFTTSAADSGAVLPICRSMFFGVTMTECLRPQVPPDVDYLDDDFQDSHESIKPRINPRINPSTKHGVNLGVNEKVIELLTDPQGCRERMQRILETLKRDSLRNFAGLSCMPLNDIVVDEYGDVNWDENQRYVDSAPWRPEPPTSIGLYHAFDRNFVNDVLEHKLFIVVDGGLPNAVDEFYNLMLDAARETTAKDVHDSEEVNWLRKASQRARLKVIKMVADEFGLDIPTEIDIYEHSTSPCEIAQATTETLHCDIVRLNAETVAVYNFACNTTLQENGVLCPMHPCEGLWLFKGPRMNHNSYHTYGSTFGSDFTCGTFPTSSFQVMKIRDGVRGYYDYRAKEDSLDRRTVSMSLRQGNVVVLEDGEFMSRMKELDPERRTPRMQLDYFCFDEGFMKNLESMQWNRDNGHIELMPIVVGLG